MNSAITTRVQALTAPAPDPTTSIMSHGLPPGPLTTAELHSAVPDARDRGRYERIWHGVYRRPDQRDDLRLRSLALARIWPEGVLRGRSAAVLWGDDSVPDTAPPEIWLPSTRRAPRGRVYRYGALPPSAVTELEGLRVTTPLRTCRDLSCDLPLEDAVISVERLCAADPDLVERLRAAVAHPSGRGARRFAAVVGQADPRSGSVEATRVRLMLKGAGFDRFTEGHQVRMGRRTIALPLADPVARCVVIAPGARSIPDQRMRDNSVRVALRRTGWTIIAVRGPEAPAQMSEPHPVQVVSGSQETVPGPVLAVLRTRWSGSVEYPPLVGEPAADPHGMWAGQRE